MALLEENDMDKDLTHYMKATSRLKAENAKLLSERKRFIEGVREARKELAKQEILIADRILYAILADSILAEMEEV